MFAEYAKDSPNDILIRVTVHNRGPEPAELHLLPTLWFRNTWAWGRTGEAYWAKPRLAKVNDGVRRAEHESLATSGSRLEPEATTQLLFTENETNTQKLFGAQPHRPT